MPDPASLDLGQSRQIAAVDWPGYKEAVKALRAATPTRDDLLVQADLGLSCVLDRLAEEADEIARLERRLRAAKQRRNALIAKCRVGGLTIRFIARIAGVTNERVAQIGIQK